MTRKTLTAIPPDEHDGFYLLQHQLLSATQRLKLATDKLSNYEDLPEDFIPAAFVVEEATLALEKIHQEFDMWYLDHEHTPAKAMQS